MEGGGGVAGRQERQMAPLAPPPPPPPPLRMTHNKLVTLAYSNYAEEVMKPCKIIGKGVALEESGSRSSASHVESSYYCTATQHAYMQWLR